MSNPVPQCTHIKTNGEVCGSPAVSGTDLCYHHSALKTAFSRPTGKAPFEGFAPIPFVFPEDRASMQINFFLLLQAFNEQRIDQKTFRLMLSMLKAMAKNLGKTGSLVETTSEAAPLSAQPTPEVGEKEDSDQLQKNQTQNSGPAPQKNAQEARRDLNDDHPMADPRHLPNPESNAPVGDRVSNKFEPQRAADGHEEQKRVATNGSH